LLHPLQTLHLLLLHLRVELLLHLLQTLLLLPHLRIELLKLLHRLLPHLLHPLLLHWLKTLVLLLELLWLLESTTQPTYTSSGLHSISHHGRPHRLRRLLLYGRIICVKCLSKLWMTFPVFPIAVPTCPIWPCNWITLSIHSCLIT
jgi:hypothetical protein